MDKDSTQNYLTTHPHLSDAQFDFLANYFQNNYGLKIPKAKKILVESRLLKRLNILKIKSIKEYLIYVFKTPAGKAEYPNFIDQITTHKTFFFRENYQFDFLKQIMSEYYTKVKGKRPIYIWCAACSTGEEVYTLLMVLDEIKKELTGLDFRIIGTDVSVPSLKKAANAVYSETEIENVPENLKVKYFTILNVKGRTMFKFCRKDLIGKIHLGVQNLNNKVYKLPHQFDFIFCRNVVIYFDKKTKDAVLQQLTEKLRIDGYLFIGHSETAYGADQKLKNIRPTIYQKYIH